MKQQMIERWSIHRGYPCGEMHIVSPANNARRVIFDQHHSVSPQLRIGDPSDHPPLSTKGADFGHP
jgi:hypothetical protein